MEPTEYKIEPKMSFITDLQVSLNAEQEKEYRTKGYTTVPNDLNQGTGGPKIYLWYKRGDRSAAITRIQFAFNDKMNDSLQYAKYKTIDKNLNEGTTGDEIYLRYFKGSSKHDVPIVNLHVTTHADDEPCMFGLGWKRLACDLNRNAGGNWIYLWVMRERPTYITDITATMNCDGDTTKFNQAYIRLDEDTNRGTNGSCIFIFYLLTTEPREAIKDVKISAGEVSGYKKVEQDLNEGIGGTPTYLWYSKMTSNPPIQDLTLILNTEAQEEYKNGMIPVIDENINPHGAPEYLSYYR